MVHNPTIRQNEDLVARLHGSNSMGNQDDGNVVAQSLHRFHDDVFGSTIQRAGCLIEHEDAWISVQRPGNADSLTLAAA